MNGKFYFRKKRILICVWYKSKSRFFHLFFQHNPLYYKKFDNLEDVDIAVSSFMEHEDINEISDLLSSVSAQVIYFNFGEF